MMAVMISLFACDTDLDCNNAGRCTAGACVCDAAWQGDSCAELALLPAPAHGNGDFEWVQQNGTFTWGGSILADPHESRFHMYASMFFLLHSIDLLNYPGGCFSALCWFFAKERANYTARRVIPRSAARRESHRCKTTPRRDMIVRDSSSSTHICVPRPTCSTC